MNTQTDLSKIYDKFIKSVFINHRGIIIERMPQGYKWNGQCFYTLEELDKAINLSLGQLKNSIYK